MYYKPGDMVVLITDQDEWVNAGILKAQTFEVGGVYEVFVTSVQSDNAVCLMNGKNIVWVDSSSIKPYDLIDELGED